MRSSDEDILEFDKVGRMAHFASEDFVNEEFWEEGSLVPTHIIPTLFHDALRKANNKAQEIHANRPHWDGTVMSVPPDHPHPSTSSTRPPRGSPDCDAGRNIISPSLLAEIEADSLWRPRSTAPLLRTKNRPETSVYRDTAIHKITTAWSVFFCSCYPMMKKTKSRQIPGRPAQRTPSLNRLRGRAKHRPRCWRIFGATKIPLLDASRPRGHRRRRWVGWP